MMRGFIIKKGPYKRSKQRERILELLRSTGSHPTADWIYQQMKREFAELSMGTVYRNLEILSDLGQIQKLHYGGTLKRFDGNPSNHYHIRCTVCGKIEHAPMDSADAIEKNLQQKTKYKIISHRLEFIGLCPECAKHMIAPGLKKSERL